MFFSGLTHSLFPWHKFDRVVFPKYAKVLRDIVQFVLVFEIYAMRVSTHMLYKAADKEI